MRTRDEQIFLKAAAKFNAWILVREDNEFSLPYVGKASYQPKPIACKPKTANNLVVEKKIAGLVADPFRWPQAFKGEKLAKAQSEWIQFRNLHQLGHFKRTPDGHVFDGRNHSALGFGIDTSPRSQHEGCLTFEGKYLYGDYDLFDIVFLGAKDSAKSHGGAGEIRGR